MSDPLLIVSRSCRWCGRDYGRSVKGRPPIYCSHTCRQRAYELRRLARALGIDDQQYACELVVAKVVYARDRWLCGLCHRKINPKLRAPDPMAASMDHVIPLSRGGSHTYANVQTAHLGCNIRKNNRGAGEQLALI